MATVKPVSQIVVYSALPPMNSVPEPATPYNPHAHTPDYDTIGYAGQDGHAFASYRMGQQSDTFNFGASSTDYSMLLGDGDDVVVIGSGNDRLYGQDGNDSLSAGGGNDLLLGGTGNDTLNGGSGVDELWGGTGNDFIIGGTGSDRLAGGNGADTFVVDFGWSFRISGRPPVTIDTVDTVLDYRSIDDSIDAGVAGTAQNYGEAMLTGGQGLDAARALGEAMIDSGKQYAFVSDGQNGYLFVDRPGDDPGVTILNGLTHLGTFGYMDLI